MIHRRFLLAAALVAPLIGIGAVLRQASPAQGSNAPVVVPDHKNGIYALGERAGWTVTLPSGAPGERWTYTARKNNAVPIGSGELDLSSGKGRIEVSCSEPAMIYLALKPPTGKPLAFGAAIDPTALKPVEPRPKDFDAFWRRKIADLDAVPENPVLTPQSTDNPGVDYETIRMDHVNGEHVYGQIAKPKRTGKFPALLILQWASPPYRLWSPWVVGPASDGWLALDIEPHDVLPTEPQPYYDALPNALKNYATIGQDDREKSYFVDMYLRDYRAVDYLTHRPDWDGKTLVVLGTSMGGQQSFAVAGLHPRVTHLIVDVPAGCDLNAGLHGRQEGYPFFPTNDPKVMETARYVDCVNFAPHIHATSLVAMGFVDNVSPPAGVWTVFNLIKGPKEAVPLIDSPHNNLATPEQQRPYTDRSAEWLDALVHGRKLSLRTDAALPSGSRK